MEICGQYSNEVKLNDKFTLAFELEIVGDYVYEASTMYQSNGDPGDPGYEEISIEDYSIYEYSLIDDNGEEISDSSVYDEYDDVIEAKINEVFKDLHACDVDWNDPED